MTTPRNPVGWFEIYVQDIERAKTFYEATLEVTLEHLPAPDIEMWAFPPVMEPDRPGCTGALVKMEGVPSGAGGTMVYFSCADCAVGAARAVEAGGVVHQEKQSIGEYGFISLVLDPDQNLVGLHSMA
jgi:hypothetical protein